MQSSVLTEKAILKRLRLLDKCGYYCVICGFDFPNVACISYEHIIPASQKRGQLKDNVGLSHYNCNILRQTLSLDDAWEEVNKIRVKLGPDNFWSWLSKKIPGRIIPAYTLLSPMIVRKMFVNKLGKIDG